MESLRESHVKDVEHSQKAFEKRYFNTVEDEETAFFRVRVEECTMRCARTGRVKTPTSSA